MSTPPPGRRARGRKSSVGGRAVADEVERCRETHTPGGAVRICGERWHGRVSEDCAAGGRRAARAAQNGQPAVSSLNRHCRPGRASTVAEITPSRWTCRRRRRRRRPRVRLARAPRGLRVIVLERDTPGAGDLARRRRHAGADRRGRVARPSGRDARARARERRRDPRVRGGARRADGHGRRTICGAARCSARATATRPRRSSASSRSAQRSGLPCERLRASEARALEPALAPTLRLALESPTTTRSIPRVLTALRRGVRARGRAAAASTPRCELARAWTSAGRARERRACSTDGSRDRRRRCVVAAGPWSTARGHPRRTRASRSVRSRARSSGCTTPPAPGC